MPVPKKRHSKTRTSTRRANWKIKSSLTVSKCPQCSAPVLPYHACNKCGTYQGRKVIEIKQKEKSSKGGSASGGKSKKEK